MCRGQILTSIIMLMSLFILHGCGECENDYDCPGHQICQSESKMCEDYICKDDSECSPGHVCRENACIQNESRTPPPSEELTL